MGHPIGYGDSALNSLVITTVIALGLRSTLT
jgi:hypothetical protein